jgi:predicted metal-dependent enzyme (double-stranded beta helix superfamily)
MDKTALHSFTEAVRFLWGPLTSELAGAIQTAMETLLGASVDETWLATLHEDAPASAELHRDPDHGFMLLAHTEQAGLYRPPHDHGRSWVLYGIQRGEIEMGTYAPVETDDGEVRLVKRNTTLVCAGQAQLYLPGDIHDTHCVSETALLFRFTERDLRVEDREHRRLTRYVDRGGIWTTSAEPA